MKKEIELRQRENGFYDNETKKYILFMCKRGCEFYDNGCTKGRSIRECAKEGLKNKE